MAQTQLNDTSGIQYFIECFDLKPDYDNFISGNGKNLQNVVYAGKIYQITPEIKKLFNNKLLEHIKRNVYHNTEYVIIYQK